MFTVAHVSMLAGVGARRPQRISTICMPRTKKEEPVTSVGQCGASVLGKQLGISLQLKVLLTLTTCSLHHYMCCH